MIGRQPLLEPSKHQRSYAVVRSPTPQALLTGPSHARDDECISKIGSKWSSVKKLERCLRAMQMPAEDQMWPVHADPWGCRYTHSWWQPANTATQYNPAQVLCKLLSIALSDHSVTWHKVKAGSGHPRHFLLMACHCHVTWQCRL